MKVYKLTHQYEGFQTLQVDSEMFSCINDNFSGMSFEGEWEVVTMTEYSKGKKSDSPPGLPSPLFSQRAADILENLLNNRCELLPLKGPAGEDYYAVNVIHTVDCIDPEKAEWSAFHNGFIRKYEKLAFKLEIIEETSIFKILDHKNHLVYGSSMTIFVTDVFRNKVLESGLLGFDFIEVWDSEEKAEKELELPYLESAPSYTFDATSALLDVGKTVASDKWAMRLDQNGDVEIGEQQPDGEYLWMDPIYYPPIFLGMAWRVVEIK